MTHKACRTCNETLPLSSFHKDSGSKDGHRRVCKTCKAAWDKQFQTENRARYLEQRKAYRQNNLVQERAKGRAWSKANYKINREAVLEASKTYYENNLTKRRSYNQKYRELNSEKLKANDRQYYKENKYVRYSSNARRRAAKLQATPKWADMEKIKEIYRQRETLSRESGIVHHVDHIVPLRGKTVCGLHVEYNLRVVPAKENLHKNCRLLDE